MIDKNKLVKRLNTLLDNPTEIDSKGLNEVLISASMILEYVIENNADFISFEKEKIVNPFYNNKDEPEYSEVLMAKIHFEGKVIKMHPEFPLDIFEYGIQDAIKMILNSDKFLQKAFKISKNNSILYFGKSYS